MPRAYASGALLETPESVLKMAPKKSKKELERERLAEEQRRTVEAGEAKATSLASELRAVNKGTLTEFEQYTAKISELRAQLVAVDNEKCEARGRAAAS